ncbi:MAG: hypothetical protein HY700_05370 [Gemmatimonadetes bacterium]|nr:hypothetical protein [Gemmatimonadota bacterium]
MRRLSLIALVSAALLIAPVAGAQNFSGTYSTPNQTGGTVTLLLQQDPQGQITGSLSGNGSTFAIQGKAQGADFVALASSGGGAVYLEGRLEGAGVRVILAEMGPGNQPRYDQARELVFARSSGGAAPAGRAAAGNPLAGPADGNPPAR